MEDSLVKQQIHEARKAVDGFGMKYIDPGEYEVVLEPAAAAGFLFFIKSTAALNINMPIETIIICNIQSYIYVLL